MSNNAPGPHSASWNDTEPLEELFSAQQQALPVERQKRRWPRRLAIVLVVLLVLLGIGAGIAEAILRQAVPGTIETAARQQLSLSADHEVEASVGGTSVLWQTLTGGYRDVTLRVPDAPLGELRGEISLSAARVPLNPTTGPLDGATARVSLTPEQLQPILSSATIGLAGEAGFEGGELQLKRSIPLFGAEVSVEVSVALDAADGDLIITPTRAKAAGLEITSGQLTEGPGQILAPLMEPREVCVRDRLPAGLTLSEIEITSSGKAIASFAVDPRIVTDAEMRAKGVCG